jgi:hypothetical protein
MVIGGVMMGRDHWLWRLLGAGAFIIGAGSLAWHVNYALRSRT